MFIRSDDEDDQRGGHRTGNSVVPGILGRSAAGLLAAGLALLARHLLGAPEPVVWGIAIVVFIGGLLAVEWHSRRRNRRDDEPDQQ